MNCPDCGLEVPEGSSFCGECGYRLSNGVPAAAQAPEAATRALLSQANLLRVRGQWEEAVERCAEVLKIDPQNAAAHSLLGEIYDNHGHLERAIRWYEEALELNPGNMADKAKLARARETLQARQRRNQPPDPSAFSWLRVARSAGVIICGGVILLALTLPRGSPGPRPPGQVPPLPGVPGPRPDMPRVVTIPERDIAGRLTPTIPQGLKLTGVQLDPRNRTARLDLLLGWPALRSFVNEAQLRAELMRHGYAVAYQVARARPDIRQVDLWMAVTRPPGGDRSPLDYYFIGSLLSTSLMVDPARLDPSDFRQIYQSVWWHPRSTL